MPGQPPIARPSTDTTAMLAIRNGRIVFTVTPVRHGARSTESVVFLHSICEGAEFREVGVDAIHHIVG